MREKTTLTLTECPVAGMSRTMNARVPANEGAPARGCYRRSCSQRAATVMLPHATINDPGPPGAAVKYAHPGERRARRVQDTTGPQQPGQEANIPSWWQASRRTKQYARAGPAWAPGPGIAYRVTAVSAPRAQRCEIRPYMADAVRRLPNTRRGFGHAIEVHSTRRNRPIRVPGPPSRPPCSHT